MAVERMEMVNIVGHMDYVDKVAKKIILSSSVHVVNAITEIQQNNFPILQAKEEVDAVIDYNYIRQYTSVKNLANIEKKISALLDIFEIKKKILSSHFEMDYSFSDDSKEIEKIYETVEERHQRLLELDKEEGALNELLNYLSFLKHIDVDLSQLMNMRYIKMRIGKLSKYNMSKLRKNYENVSAIVFKLNTEIDHVVILTFVPKPLEIEVDRVLKSLNFDEYIIKNNFSGTPAEWIEKIKTRKFQIRRENDFIKAQLLDIKNSHEKEIEKYYSRLMMEYKIEELKNHIACTNEFFYLTGWVPKYKKRMLLNSLGKYEEGLITVFREIMDVREELQPPTCLKNNLLIKPFETIVKMYGVPSYTELDPTGFLGLSYMILFGAMFGDVGQGLVLFLGGMILSFRKKALILSGVIARLGISSMIFGSFYGSIFGFEDIIKNRIIRPIKPMDNINLMLILAVAFGVILLSVGFIYNLANSYKNRDFEGGLLSRNGLSGLLFYWLLLYVIGTKVLGTNTFVSEGILAAVLIALMAVMLFKEPLANLIRGIRPLYSESKTDYYIEGGFGVIETLLTMFSNTVSFIRVGAFAINHVGLFIAFQTLADMMSNNIESIMMIILGNVIIIGLEGLIVFIQGLRLEYYELFSKYFRGVGYEYNPCHIEGIIFEKKIRKDLKRRTGIKTNKNMNAKIS